MSENVAIGVFDTDLLRYFYPEWNALSKHERYLLIRSHFPEEIRQSSNVTCVQFHRWLAQVINPEESADDKVRTLHIGNGGTQRGSSDTELNNKVGEIDITDSVYDAEDEHSRFIIFIDSTESNGFTLNELGLVSREGRFLNHAPINPAIEKTSAKTLIVEVEIAFS